MSRTTNTVYIARLAGVAVFDPIGDRVGRVRDVVILLREGGTSRAVGLVVEVPGKRRVFLPLTRVTSFDANQVISTGVVNMRRFEQRPAETLALSELLDREVTLTDESGQATILDIAIDKNRTGEWIVSQLFVRRILPPARGLAIRRRGESMVVDIDQVTGLGGEPSGPQGTDALLATMDDLKPADLADALHELPPSRRLEVAGALRDERLADVLEEMSDEDSVQVLSGLAPERAADVLDVMEPDDAADLINELPGEQAKALLELMEPDEARDVRRLLAYGEHTAGGLMTPEPVVLSPETTIAMALAHVRRQDLTPALAAMVFVTRPPTDTPTGRFLGVAHLQRMLREPPHQPLGTIMDSDIEWLGPSDPLGKVTRLLATYNLTALPVLDDERHLLGAVSVDDVLDHLLPEDWREADDEVTDHSMDDPATLTPHLATTAARVMSRRPAREVASDGR